MVKILFISAVCIACSFTSAFADPSLYFREGADETFTIGNAKTSFHFSLKKGVLSLLHEETAEKERRLAFKKAHLFTKSKPVRYRSNHFETQHIPADRVTNSHLRVTLTSEGPKLSRQIVFRIYPKSTMLGCDVYYRGKRFPGNPNDIALFSMKTAERHWSYKAVEFFDRTDENNNLVREYEIIGYEKQQQLNGSLLFAKNLITNASFILLKEAPSSFSQLNHPGYDFKLSKSGLSLHGSGFNASDLSADEWTKGYSIALGSCGPKEVDQLSVLRDYQQSIRAYRPEWDEMIMMNTWGDRNRDANIGEEFVKREVDACKRLGITHFQIDDGWQQGLSKNSAAKSGSKWDQWDLKDWEPHRDRFPNGFQTVVDYAKEQGVTLGLWFAPSNANSFADWERDAKVIINLNKKYGIRYFKIDGIRLPNKLAEENLRKMYSLILKETQHGVFFNVDATAHRRGGYHFLYEYGGNIFLENRYTTWSKYYYPYQSLRNLWMLSKYVPAERFQIEFLNKWKNLKSYGKTDLFAPINVPFEYMFATTMMAQPLAWFEGSALPEEAFAIGQTIKDYASVQAKVHQGKIFPIGKEPNGRSWTGFQSILSPDEGYLMIYRELNDTSTGFLKTYLPSGNQYTFKRVLGQGTLKHLEGVDGPLIQASFDKPQSYGLFHYRKTP